MGHLTHTVCRVCTNYDFGGCALICTFATIFLQDGWVYPMFNDRGQIFVVNGQKYCRLKRFHPAPNQGKNLWLPKYLCSVLVPLHVGSCLTAVRPEGTMLFQKDQVGQC